MSRFVLSVFLVAGAVSIVHVSAEHNKVSPLMSPEKAVAV